MRRVPLTLGILLVVSVALIVLARVTSKPIDGISCDFSEAGTYHVHAHLTIVVDGKVVAGPPAGTGIHLEHLCLYWLHTHDTTGIIHIEAPHPISPTLGQFFDIWGRPLSSRQVAGYRVGPGRSLRVYLGHTPVATNPRAIRLGQHTAVTLEIGPPFIPPLAVDWHGL